MNMIILNRCRNTLFPCQRFRYRIIAAFIIGITAEKPFTGENRPQEGSVSFNSPSSICGTDGCETAVRTVKRRNGPLEKTNQQPCPSLETAVNTPVIVVPVFLRICFLNNSFITDGDTPLPRRKGIPGKDRYCHGNETEDN